MTYCEYRITFKLIDKDLISRYHVMLPSYIKSIIEERGITSLSVEEYYLLLHFSELVYKKQCIRIGIRGSIHRASIVDGTAEELLFKLVTWTL